MKLTDEKANHIMIDIETMGLLSNSSICSVGAVRFNISDGVFENQFYRENLSLNEQVLQHGRVIYPDTVRFWAKQDRKAQVCFEGDRIGSYKEGIIDFYTWMKCNNNDETYVWCKSPQLDISILEDAFFKLGFDIPWSYKKIVDLRTLSVLIPCEIECSGIKHNALDDAKNQALQAIDILRIFQQTCGMAATWSVTHGHSDLPDNSTYTISVGKLRQCKK